MLNLLQCNAVSKFTRYGVTQWLSLSQEGNQNTPLQEDCKIALITIIVVLDSFINFLKYRNLICSELARAEAISRLMKNG